VVAVDELLFREGCKFVSSDLPGTLKRTSGRERPARTALALVLDGGNSTLGSPVHIGSEVFGRSPEGFTKVIAFENSWWELLGIFYGSASWFDGSGYTP